MTTLLYLDRVNYDIRTGMYEYETDFKQLLLYFDCDQEKASPYRRLQRYRAMTNFLTALTTFYDAYRAAGPLPAAPTRSKVLAYLDKVLNLLSELRVMLIDNTVPWFWQIVSDEAVAAAAAAYNTALLQWVEVANG